MLTDTQRTIQEICVAETTRPDWIPPPNLKELHEGSTADTREKEPGDGLESKNTPSLPPTDKLPKSASSRETELGGETSQSEESDEPRCFGGRVVFDLLSLPTAPDGQRFEDNLTVRNHINTVRPLLTLLAAANLPVADSQYQ